MSVCPPRLFTLPHRDAVFPDLCLQCTRRQDQQENAERKRRHKKTDGKSKEGVERPTVYICATMWHEVRQEMLQLLKSLFRCVVFRHEPPMEGGGHYLVSGVNANMVDICYVCCCQ